jgi:hypothetical protein
MEKISALHSYINLHEKQILSTRESLFRDLFLVDKNLWESTKAIFQKKREESGYAPLWWEIIPCIYRDVFQLDWSYEEIFKAWFALYIQMIVLDDVSDKNRILSPSSHYQSVLLQLKWLWKLSSYVARSTKQKLFDDMVLSAFTSQLEDVSLKSTLSESKKQNVSINKRSLNHLPAIVISNRLPQYEDTIMWISKLITSIEAIFDDIQDIQEDFDEDNYSPLILRVLWDRATSFTWDIFGECMRSWVLTQELSTSKSIVAEILTTLESWGLENIQQTSSWNMFRQMYDDIEFVLNSLKSFDLTTFNESEIIEIKSLIKKVIPL